MTDNNTLILPLLPLRDIVVFPESLQALFGVRNRILGHDSDEVDAVETKPDDIERFLAGRRDLKRDAHARPSYSLAPRSRPATSGLRSRTG